MNKKIARFKMNAIFKKAHFFAVEKISKIFKIDFTSILTNLANSLYYNELSFAALCSIVQELCFPALLFFQETFKSFCFEHFAF